MKPSTQPARYLAATALLFCCVSAMPAAAAAADAPAAADEQAVIATAEFSFAHARIVPLEEALELASGEAMRVALDPETGELRTPKPSEIAGELRASRAGSSARRATAPSTAIVLSNGTVAQRVSPELMNYSVGRITADGSVAYACAEGEHQPHATTGQAPAVREVE